MKQRINIKSKLLAILLMSIILMGLYSFCNSVSAQTDENRNTESAVTVNDYVDSEYLFDYDGAQELSRYTIDEYANY